MTPTPEEKADRIPCAVCGIYKPWHYAFEGDQIGGHDYQPKVMPPDRDKLVGAGLLNRGKA